jgi:hypothetical protein
MEGPVDPLSLLGYTYSFDGPHWNNLPPWLASVTGRYGLAYWPKVPSGLCEGVVELVAKGIEEPLGHQLFREAYSVRAVSLRSALMIGLGAGEVGFKRLLLKKACLHRRSVSPGIR